MNSKFKLTNSSDHLNLDLGCPWIQELSDVKDKRSSEYRIYIESSVEAQKLVPDSDGETKLSDTIETILVEPHQFTLVSTPLTKEFLAFEERQKVRDAAKAEKEKDKDNGDPTSIKEEILTNTEVEPENSKLPPSKPIRRRKSLEKTPKPKPNTYSKQSVTTTPVSKQSQPVTPSNKTTTPASISPQKSPNLLTIPKLPTHPLPPTSSMLSSISTPPPLPALARIPKQYAGARATPHLISSPPTITSTPVMSSFTPVISSPTPVISSPAPIISSPPSFSSPPTLFSPPTVSTPSIASPSTPRDPSNDLRPIQVPMPGPNGTQILQTINVPRSVLATASDKPILLTVTPKNGINKGMKQVLVLTKTQPGASKGPPMFNFSLGQTSPGNVTLSPRSSLTTTPPRLPTEPLPPSIKDLQHPLPRQPATSTLLSGPSLPSPGQISPGAARAPVVRTVAPTSVASPVIVTRALTTARPGSVVLTSRSQEGQTGGTRQVVSSQAAPAGSRVGQVMQTVAVNNQDAGRLVVPGPLRGRLVSGQAAPGGQGLVVGQRVVQGQRVMAGQRIVTAGGQSMVVSASGQTMVLPAGARQVMAGGVRQVVQGGTRQLGQVVRQVVPGRQVIVSSASQVAGNSPQFIRVVSSRAGGQPMVVRQAVPGAVANGGQTLAYRDPNTGVVHNNRVRVVSQGGDLGQMRVVQQVQGGQRLVQTSPVQQRTAVEVGASDQDKPNAPLSRILNALHNRGLVTQHNGKFYYVGDKGKQATAAAGKVQAGGVVRVQGTPSVATSVAQASHSVVQTAQNSLGVVQTVQAGQSTQGSPSRFQAVQAIPSVPSTPTKVIPPPPVNSFEGQFASFVSKREVPSQSPVANGQTHKLVTLRGMGGGPNIPVSQHTELVDLTGAASEPSESGGHLQGTKRLAGNVTEIGPMQEKRIKTIPSSSNDFVYYR